MAKEIYGLPQTQMTWQDSGGDFVMSLAGLNTGGGRIGAQWDRGAGALPCRFRWQFKCRANSTPTVGNTLRVYLALGEDSGTVISNGLGQSDAAITTEALTGNCEYLDALEITEASTTRVFTISGRPIWIFSRYVSPIIFNATGVSLHATANENQFILKPYPDQIQP